MIKPRFNIAPHTFKTESLAPVILQEEGERECKMMFWGLLSPKAEDRSFSRQWGTNCAREDKIQFRDSYKEPFEKRRCLVPAVVYFEWIDKEVRTKNKIKVNYPYCFRLKSQEPFAMAGIWQPWVDKKTGEVLDTFSIVTVDPNPEFRRVHDRMPAILDEEGEAIWLDPKNNGNVRQLKDLLKARSSKGMEVLKMDPVMNAATNDGPQYFKPIETFYSSS